MRSDGRPCSITPFHTLRIPMIVLPLIIVSGVSGCQKAKIHKPGGDIDLGLVCATITPNVRTSFDVVNNTDRKIRILGETHSCSCTHVHYRDSEIPPGGSTVLELAVDMPRTNQSGTINCVLKTDDPAFPEWNYSVKFSSYVQASVSPNTIDLGAYHLGDRKPPQKYVELNVYSPKPYCSPPRPVKIDCSPEIDVSLDPVRPVEWIRGSITERTYRMRVTIRSADLAPGSFARSMVVRLDDDSEATGLIVWSVRGPWVVSPSQLHLGLLEPGKQPRTKTIQVKTADKSSFDVISAACDNASVRIDSVEGLSLDTKKITITLSPESAPGKPVITGLLKIKTQGLKGTSDVQIPWSAFRQRTTAQGAPGKTSTRSFEFDHETGSTGGPVTPG